MHCPHHTCNSLNINSKRKFDSRNETNMGKYRGINCTKRYYKCANCGNYFRTIEITEEDFAKINGYQLRQEIGSSGRIR